MDWRRRLLLGIGIRSGSTKAQLACVVKSSMTTVMVWAMPRASSETSEPKSDLATISSVRVIMSACTSRSSPGFHPASIDAVD